MIILDLKSMFIGKIKPYFENIVIGFYLFFILFLIINFFN